MPYITIRWKFIITVTVSTLWMLLSIWLSVPWYDQLSEHTTPFIAAFLIGFIAIIPGFMNAFIMVALALDKRPRVPLLDHYPDVTVLVAAYNEAASIEDTVRSLMRQTYPGKLHVTVINDGSADSTADIVRSLLPEYSNLNLLDLHKNGGKANALNQGLAQCNSPYVITVDADCWIWKDGIQNLVGRRLADPANTRAVAGAILIRNSRQNWLTKAQEWDYFLGIAAIKRIQSLFQGTLVAQGAFSLYDRETLVEVGGWPHTVGEEWPVFRAFCQRREQELFRRHGFNADFAAVFRFLELHVIEGHPHRIQIGLASGNDLERRVGQHRRQLVFAQAAISIG
ncbi:MAG: glycosyltransferase family 2 protein, partial [Limnohabitans sp.]|nr:glycosyltransferase family 2 protein [Limnohabitans sp.]